MLVGSKTKDIPDIETVIKDLALTLSDTRTIDIDRSQRAVHDLFSALQPFRTYSKDSGKDPLMDTDGGAIFFIFYEYTDYREAPGGCRVLNPGVFDVIYPDQSLIIRWTHVMPSRPAFINKYKNAGECPWLKKVFDMSGRLWLFPLNNADVMMRVPPDSPQHELWRGFVDAMKVGQRTGEEIFGMYM